MSDIVEPEAYDVLMLGMIADTLDGDGEEIAASRRIRAAAAEITRLRVLVGEAGGVLKYYAMSQIYTERKTLKPAVLYDNGARASSLLKRIEGSAQSCLPVSPQERHTEDGVKLEEG